MIMMIAGPVCRQVDLFSLICMVFVAMKMLTMLSKICSALLSTCGIGLPVYARCDDLILIKYSDLSMTVFVRLLWAILFRN